MVSLSDRVQFDNLITVILFVITVLQFIKTIKSSNKNDTEKLIEAEKQRMLESRSQHEQLIKTNIKLDEICRGNNDIIASFKSLQNTVNQMHDTVISHEMRLDHHDKRIEKIEEKIEKGDI